MYLIYVISDFCVNEFFSHLIVSPRLVYIITYNKIRWGSRVGALRCNIILEKKKIGDYCIADGSSLHRWRHIHQDGDWAEDFIYHQTGAPGTRRGLIRNRIKTFFFLFFFTPRLANASRTVLIRLLQIRRRRRWRRRRRTGPRHLLVKVTFDYHSVAYFSKRPSYT